jgi:hypothetical protein
VAGGFRCAQNQAMAGLCRLKPEGGRCDGAQGRECLQVMISEVKLIVHALQEHRNIVRSFMPNVTWKAMPTKTDIRYFADWSGPVRLVTGS